jgi:D-aminopeptidase
MFSASCLHPEVTKKGIRDGVAAALQGISSRRPYEMEPPYTFALEWNSTTIASTCEYFPNIKKTSPRTTEYTTANLPEAMSVVFAECILALQVGQKGIYS